jgi:hypothetical protein
MRNREEGQVALMFLLIGYLILGTTMMWFIVSGISGETVNYVNIPAQGHINKTSSINFTSSVPTDLYRTDLSVGRWIRNDGVGLIAKPLPLFPSFLALSGVIAQDGYYKNTYYINNTFHDRFGISIDSAGIFSELYLLIEGNHIYLYQDNNPVNTYSYDGGIEDYTSYTDSIWTTWFNPGSRELQVYKTDDFGTAQLFTWTLPSSTAATQDVYHGGIIGFEEFTTVSRIDTVSVITYNPKTDIASQSMNFATFIFELASFQAPSELFPPPFISILIPALFFYLPLLGILACIVNIMWPVV